MNDVIIIGGGFYGCMIALYYHRLGKKVLIIEKEANLMLKASFNNQARVHNGYHYPRALMTAINSHKNYARFIKEFSDSVKNSFIMTYVIAKGSKTNAKDFERIYKKIGSPLKKPSNKVLSLLNINLIEKAYAVKECVFDGNILRKIIKSKLSKARIQILYNSEVLKILKGMVIVTTKNKFEIQIIKTKKIINCAYANINDLLKKSDLQELPIINENTVMPLIKVPKEFKNLGITIMDGDFFAVMPFPAKNCHTIHHVKFTPMEGEHQQEIINDAIKFIPCLKKAKHIGSIKEIKTILLINKEDDGRPSLYKKDYGFKGLDIILGSKLDTVYDIFKKLNNIKTKNLNII